MTIEMFLWTILYLSGILPFAKILFIEKILDNKSPAFFIVTVPMIWPLYIFSLFGQIIIMAVYIIFIGLKNLIKYLIDEK